MNTKILTELGLTEDETKIYSSLIEGGLMPARMISLKSNIGRQLTYKILDDLIKKGIVEKRETEKITLFAPVHPSQLKVLFNNKKKEIEQIEKQLDESLGLMVSKYNLFVGKPNVQFFEGQEGAEKIVGDYISPESEVLSYLDNEAVNKYMPILNKEHVSERKKLKIKKKMLVVDSVYIRNHVKDMDKEITEVRIIPKSEAFSTGMQIYGNKVSYLTLSENKKIGVIIEDKDIAHMHRVIFQALWERAETLEVGI
jgi:sugar-specific transcriptional regulator TrmB